MAAIRAQDEPKMGGYRTVNDPILAATMGTLGFVLRCVQPIEVLYNANAIVAFDRGNGEVANLASVQIHFEESVQHEHFGPINFFQVECAHALAKLAQRKKRGDSSDALQAKIDAAHIKAQKARVSNPLFFFVQGLYDQVTNLNVLGEVISKLNDDNPYLKFMAAIANNGVAHTLNPLHCEDTAFRRSERLFRGESGRIHHPTR